MNLSTWEGRGETVGGVLVYDKREWLERRVESRIVHVCLCECLCAGRVEQDVYDSEVAHYDRRRT